MLNVGERRGVEILDMECNKEGSWRESKGGLVIEIQGKGMETVIARWS